MVSGDIDDRMETVARRVEFIELLDSSGALDTRSIVDRLDHSRSTVTRALRELREADLVEKSQEGYDATVPGVMAAEEYRRHEAAIESILSTKELLDPIPADRAPPVELLTQGEVHLVGESAPFAPLQAVSERVREADAVRAYVPTLLTPSVLRDLHRTVTERDVKAEVAFDPDLLSVLKVRYPGVLSEMAAVESFSAFAVDGASYGIVLTETDDATTVTVVVYENGTGIRGVVTADSPTVTDWARTELGRLTTDGAEATEQLEAMRAAVGDGPSEYTLSGPNDSRSARRRELAGRDLPVELESQGFVRLSREYFDSHEQAPPEVSWRTGFTLSEVHAGHAVDRTDSEGRNLTDTIVENLRTEGDHVVVGPPGAGKSTICMSVACEWYDRDVGPVLYRERGVGDPFDSTALLEAYLRQTEGHALVVVEDCVYEETAPVFEVMRSLSEHESVTFLLDAREEAWEDGDGVGIDPRRDAYRRNSVERFDVPAFDERECERFVARLDELVDDDLDVDATELSSVVGDASAPDDADRPAPGGALLVQHYLSRKLDPLAEYDDSASTALEADVRRTYRTLADAEPEGALTVGVLANVLNAAGVPVAREYLHSLSGHDDRYDVEESIAVLEGRVLFDGTRPSALEDTYRTPHRTWSVEFLEAFLDAVPERRARRRFTACVDALLALSEDAQLRQRLERQLSGRTAHLHRIEADPGRWADAVAEKVFQLGRENAGFAPLYSSPDGTAIELPEPCSDGIEVQCTYWRAQMHLQSGPLEAAVSAFQSLDEKARAATFDDTTAKRWRVRSYCGRSGCESLRGNLELAEEHLERALELARDLGDPTTLADVLLDAGNTAYWNGEYELARERYEECLGTARDAGYPKIVARALTGLGAVAHERGDLDAADERLREAFEASVDAGDRSNEAESAGHLGDVAYDRNDLEAASRWYRREFEVANDIGRRRSEGEALRNLGAVAFAEGDFDRAVEHATRAFETYGEINEPSGEAESLALLAEISHEQGRYDDANAYANEALEKFAAGSNDRGKSRCHRLAARSAVSRSRIPEAVRHLERAERLVEDGDATEAVADCRALRARIDIERGNDEAAREAARDARERFESVGSRRGLAEALVVAAEAERNLGNDEAADELLDEALAEARESGLAHVLARVRETMDAHDEPNRCKP